jgi:alkaline phosphatase D
MRSLGRHIALRAFVAAVLASAAPSLTARGDEPTGAHLAMGFRVGEVTQDSAIVWTRVTAHSRRNAETGKNPEADDDIARLEGAVPGAPGSVRLLVSTTADFANATTHDWAPVAAERDFTRQFMLKSLKPATKYFVKVEARPPAGGAATAGHQGSFTTAVSPDQWQDVSFAVITGKAYKDLDHADGYHMYPAMGKLNLSFLVPTGDTVYYDNDPPNAKTIAMARHHWHRMYSLPRLVEFHRAVPGYWEKDDHDTIVNDCWPSMKVGGGVQFTFAEGQAIFREQVPMGELTYRTVRWGKGLQVWMVEGRDFRSPNNMPDGPEKTIWGAEQLAWLKRTVLASDADFRVLISPTPIVGPDRANKADNHANKAFATEGNAFRQWTKDEKLTHFYVCCGDRHWQYMSIDPATGLREFSCGPASDQHAGGTPGQNPEYQPFHRVKGGFLSVTVTRQKNVPTAAFRFHDVHGEVVYEYVAKSPAGAE